MTDTPIFMCRAGKLTELISLHPVPPAALPTAPTRNSVRAAVLFSCGPLISRSAALARASAANLDADVVLIGAQRGNIPQHGDDVLVWGQWDASLRAYRAWRVQIVQRNGQPTNLELTTGRPIPFALLSLIFFAFVFLACLHSLFVRVF